MAAIFYDHPASLNKRGAMSIAAVIAIVAAVVVAGGAVIAYTYLSDESSSSWADVSADALGSEELGAFEGVTGVNVVSAYDADGSTYVNGTFRHAGDGADHGFSILFTGDRDPRLGYCDDDLKWYKGQATADLDPNFDWVQASKKAVEDNSGYTGVDIAHLEKETDGDWYVYEIEGVFLCAEDQQAREFELVFGSDKGLLFAEIGDRPVFAKGVDLSQGSYGGDWSDKAASALDEAYNNIVIEEIEDVEYDPKSATYEVEGDFRADNVRSDSDFEIVFDSDRDPVAVYVEDRLVWPTDGTVKTDWEKDLTDVLNKNGYTEVRYSGAIESEFENGQYEVEADFFAKNADGRAGMYEVEAHFDKDGNLVDSRIERD